MFHAFRGIVLFVMCFPAALSWSVSCIWMRGIRSWSIEVCLEPFTCRFVDMLISTAVLPVPLWRYCCCDYSSNVNYIPRWFISYIHVGLYVRGFQPMCMLVVFMSPRLGFVCMTVLCLLSPVAAALSDRAVVLKSAPVLYDSIFSRAMLSCKLGVRQFFLHSIPSWSWDKSFWYELHWRVCVGLLQPDIDGDTELILIYGYEYEYDMVFAVFAR